MDHHPDIQAALNVCAKTAPVVAARASASIGILLRQAYMTENRSVAHHQTAWNFSTLTGDGFPMEWAFTNADAQLRYVVDPGGPDVRPADRLGRAAELLAELNQPVNPQLLDELNNCHHAVPEDALRYGAWIGGRHPMAGSVDRFKLYIEIPARYIRAAQSLLTPFLRSRPHLPERELQLRMLGLEPATGRMEFYYRVEDLSSAMLSHLLYPAGLRSRADELLNCVEEAYGYSLRAPGTRIPGGSVGFSYAVSPDTNRVMFTLFLYARLLWGGDARIRTRFCEWLESVGQDSLRYREMTASLSSRDIFQTYHSSIGFILTSDAPIPISLGVRPPPVQNQLDLLSLPSQNTPEQKYL